MTLSEYLKTVFTEYMESDEFAEEDYFLSEVIHDFKFANWPKIKTMNFRGDEVYEALDLENFEVGGLHTNGFILFAGGDWQAPMTMDITFTDKTFFCSNIQPAKHNSGSWVSCREFIEFYNLKG